MFDLPINIFSHIAMSMVALCTCAMGDGHHSLYEKGHFGVAWPLKKQKRFQLVYKGFKFSIFTLLFCEMGYNRCRQILSALFVLSFALGEEWKID